MTFSRNNALAGKFFSRQRSFFFFFFFFFLRRVSYLQCRIALVGIASVIDGDTIEIHGQRIRLFAIDAPESSQLCIRASGERWRCGQQAIGSDALP